MKLPSILLPAILILAGMLAATTEVCAQRSAPPGGRPPGAGGRPPGANYPSIYSPYRGFNSPGISITIGGYGPGYNPYSTYPAFGPGYNPYSTFPPYYPAPSVTPRFAYDPPIVIVQTPSVPQAPAIPAGAAQIRVLLPDANAKVWFDGTLTKQTGTDRYFHTPELAPDSSNMYRIRAAWMEDGTEAIQERVVTVTRGQTTVADFR